MNNLLLLIARILLSGIFVLSGISKLADPGATAGYIASVGLPGPILLAWLAIAFEIIVGLMLLLGFCGRLAAIALAGFCVFTALVFHSNFADQIQMILFMKNFAIAGGMLALLVAGSGRYSIRS